MDNKPVFYPLSESQKSIWYLEKAYPGTSINIVAGTMRIKGEINYPAMAKALNIFVKRNDSMRLRIREADGTAEQYLTCYEEFDVDFFDFSTGGLKALFEWDEATTRKPFVINDKPLFYGAVFEVGNGEGGVYVKMHHLISDAWTMGLLVRQLVHYYTKIISGQTVDETTNPSYIEHLLGEQEYEKSRRFEKDRVYWLDKFETLPDMTVLKPVKTSDSQLRAKRKTLITPLKLSAKIREYCAVNKVSVFTLFMSALAIYINRVTGIDDIVLGTTILNRTSVKDKETTGMFVSVAAPVRITVDDSADFNTFSKAMLKENTNVLRHQKYPYNYLISELKKKHRRADRLFDIVLSYQNSKFHKDEADIDYVAKWLFSGYQVESLIISVNDRDDGGNLIIDYDFLTDVYNIKEIEFIHQHVISLLWHALDNPVRKISKLEMISEKEKQTILRDFNDTYADYPRDKTISQIFEEQAEKSGDKTALIFGDAVMTYRELNTKANRLAQTLRDKGVGPEKIVGITAYRSFEMIVGILGILKAGGAYLPIDPDYPKERRGYMLRDSGACALLTQGSLLDSPDFDGEILSLDNDHSYTGDGGNFPSVCSSGNLAYVIYTSGSTGIPKGVMLEHSGVVSSFCWGVGKYSLDASSVILQKTALTFDPSVWEIFWWLMLGGKVCLIESGDEKDPEAIITAIEKHSVTAMHFVPSMLSVFLSYVEASASQSRLKTLRQVLSCGEAIGIKQVRLFNKLLYESNGTMLYNMYGPTEATVEVSCFDCSPDVGLGTVPIGRRIDNFKVYILDRNKNLLPIGIPGEIYISGVGLARGYLGNEILTAERFVENPFVHGEKMYRTGDKARWYPKGDIEFLGRTDYQVKIKGYRIELGEIESRLLCHPAVLEAAVKNFEDDAGNMFLAAYIVTSEETGAEVLRTFLAEKLPEYMVPTRFVFIDKMPVNDNGKADRNALPKPASLSAPVLDYVSPSDETEAVLAEIWQSVLGISRIGVLDDYTGAGGDSLKAVMIVTGIKKRFGVDVSPKDVFLFKNIRELAGLIKKSTVVGYTPIPRVAKSDWYPVSAAQKRQYVEYNLFGGTSFHIVSCNIITGNIDQEEFRNAFRKIVQRHESLRTSFEIHNGSLVQIIHENIDFNIETTDADEKDIDKMITDFIRPFDLTRAPLFRAKILNFSPNKQLFILDTHHIISDGESLNIIVKEMTALLSGVPLPELKIQYKDYSAWHNVHLKSEEMQRQEAYWLNRLAGDIPVLNMPLDFERPSLKSLKGNRLQFDICKELTQELKGLSSLMGTTLYMTLMSAYCILLSKYTLQEDIIVGIPVEGRNHPDLKDNIGMFVNTPVVRSQPVGEKTFRSYLTEVKEELLNVYSNQDYPFEELVSKLGLKRETNRGQLFDTLFVMYNVNKSELVTPDFTMELYKYYDRSSKADISISVLDKGETIHYSFAYSTELFKAETVERFAKHFEEILWEIVRNPSIKINDINAGKNTVKDNSKDNDMKLEPTA